MPRFKTSVLFLAILAMPRLVLACAFCEPSQPTLTEQIDGADVAAIARLTHYRKYEKGKLDLSRDSRATFRIVRVLRGREALGEVREVKINYFGDRGEKAKFLMFGNGKPDLSWATPVLLTDPSYDYLKQMLQFPRDGAKRLALAVNYLEDEERLLRRDAYDEFARAPHETVARIKSSLRPDVLSERLGDTNKKTRLSTSLQRLYLTLLGICGDDRHCPFVEQQLRAAAKQTTPGVDALAGCYLSLACGEGLALVEELFLSREDPDVYTHSTAAITALRFHGERGTIARNKIVEVFRRTLDKPQLAEKVIVDLSRWEDWQSLDRITRLFDEGGTGSILLREAVVKYLFACPLPEAKETLDGYQESHPKLVTRVLATVNFGVESRPNRVASTAEPKAEKLAAKTASGDPADAAATSSTDKNGVDLLLGAVVGTALFVVLFWLATKKGRPQSTH